VQPPKTAKPASGLSAGPVSNADQLGSEISPSNNPNAAGPQAPPDDRGEGDLEFFRARAGINSRIRLPFENEFAPCVLGPGRSAFVRILIERDADGQPKRRARRRLRFCEGGTA
jgi:hypothetical protein